MNLYKYFPSGAAAIIFFIAFVIGGAWHLYIIVRKRAWYFTPMLIGCILELAGYMARFLSSNAPDETGFFMIQTLCLLVAPALFAASIYMVLGRLILHLQSASLSPIKPSRLTKIFVIGDILFFIVQIMGAGMLASTSTMNTGKTVILLGLAVQLIFFGLFVAVTAVFHSRMSKQVPAAVMEEEAHTGWGRRFSGWRGVMSVLYIASGMIFVRSLFRLAEYVEGNDGVLLGTEVFLYIFDALLMLGVVAITAVFHPAQYVARKKQLVELQSMERTY
ncbi:RTA-like protein [Colletotrichum godetiae]|uniref:RTA-like protein n=1 Tax=Colletotrichum godetiae TaxID=1209918 RepID=A0AAJ0A7L6_9PEZI|nr:RTA-like protein [Colletotrichum godetiae]KAK1658014.1 RTA-like protein [Colletotrichum godetiae]